MVALQVINVSRIKACLANWAVVNQLAVSCGFCTPTKSSIAPFNRKLSRQPIADKEQRWFV